MYCDVVVTSGTGTGVAAVASKPLALRTLAPEVPLALGSGVSAENVGEYTEVGVDVFLVASSIAKSFYEVDNRKLLSFIAAVERTQLPLSIAHDDDTSVPTVQEALGGEPVSDLGRAAGVKKRKVELLL